MEIGKTQLVKTNILPIYSKISLPKIVKQVERQNCVIWLVDIKLNSEQGNYTERTLPNNKQCLLFQDTCIFMYILHNTHVYLGFFHLSDPTSTVRLLLVRIRFLVIPGDQTTVDVESWNLRKSVDNEHVVNSNDTTCLDDMLPPCVDQIWLTYFVKLHGHRAINVSVIRGIISLCNSDNLPLRNQLKKLTKGVMLMESYILDCHFQFSLRFIYRFLKKHKQLICAVKYCFQNKLTCGLSNAISITVCP